MYLIMELLTGGELLDAVLDKGSYSEADARLCFLQLLRGIHYLHSQCAPRPRPPRRRDAEGICACLARPSHSCECMRSPHGCGRTLPFPERLPDRDRRAGGTSPVFSLTRERTSPICNTDSNFIWSRVFNDKRVVYTCTCA